MSAAAPAPGPQQLPETWDTVAPTYAQDIAQWADYAKEALRLVPVGRNDRVLDVATGPGTLAFVAANQANRVDAVDFSPGMIEQLRQRATREGVQNVEGAVMDAQALQFPDATFDVAFCLFGYFFFPDRAHAFREMHRVLRPSGRALIATWSPIDKRPAMKLAFEAVAEALPQFPRPAKGDLQDPRECVQEMTDAGFRDVTAHLFTGSMHVNSPEHYLDIIIRSAAPFAAMRKKIGEEAFRAAMDRVLAALRQRIPSDGTDLSAEAILTIGIR
jgi:ubiquinone/menaquinone biosynthesis C-methylase UbiE